VTEPQDASDIEQYD